MNRKERKMLKRHLRELQDEDPEVGFIFDVTEEETDWLKRPPKKKEQDD